MFSFLGAFLCEPLRFFANSAYRSASRYAEVTFKAAPSAGPLLPGDSDALSFVEVSRSKRRTFHYHQNNR